MFLDLFADAVLLWCSTLCALRLLQSLCGALRCSVLLQISVLFANAWWCDTVRCGPIWCDAVRCGAMWSFVVRYGAIRCDTVRYGAIRCDTVRYGAIRCDTVRYAATVKLCAGALCCRYGCSTQPTPEVNTLECLSTMALRSVRWLELAVRSYVFATSIYLNPSQIK
jgi:hypothetical protein